MKLVIAEKPSVAVTIAKVTHARTKKTDIMRGMDTLFLGVEVI